MSYRLDYEESIDRVTRRFVEEHKEIGRKLGRVLEICRNEKGDMKVAVSLLKATSTELLRHAVEEEARLAKVIMDSSETRKASADSIKILQEHRRITEFLDNELPFLLDENSDQASRKKMIRFIEEVIQHHDREEKELFPLAQKANLLLGN
jgi:hemerythrin-like domain-containing protein